MFIIAGLGNPTMKYSGTKHNVGFDCIDALAKEHKIKMKENKFHALCGTGTIGGQKVMLVKPMTFMNESGQALRAAVDFYKEDATDNVLIIYDDVALEVGRLRIRAKGSSGGHNGIKSIIAHLGTEEFKRIRVGIGSADEGDMVNHVLGHFSRSDRKLIDEAIENACEATEIIIKDGINAAMNKYN